MNNSVSLIRSRAFMALGTALALTLGFGSSSHADFILKDGHVDIAVAYQNGELSWVFDADGATSEAGGNLEGHFSPTSLSVRVPDVTNINQSPGISDSTGYTGSGSYFLMPSGGHPVGVEAPFLGWARGTGLTISDWQSDILVELIDATMPAGGEFSLWVGLNIFISTFDPSTSGDENRFSLPGHTHYNWGFTTAGVYDLTLRASGVHNQDGEKSTTATFRFLVGDATAIPEPASSALLMFGLGLAGIAVRRRRTQATCVAK